MADELGLKQAWLDQEMPRIVKAVKELQDRIPEHEFERVPVPRLVNPLPRALKWRIAARKFLPGFVIGTAVSVGQAMMMGTPLGWGLLIVSAAQGVGAGLGWTGLKYVKETRLDKRLDTTVRSKLEASEASTQTVYMELISTFLGLAQSMKLFGVNTPEALKYIATHADLVGRLPFEVGEFLITIGACLADDSPGSTGLTAGEISLIMDEARDMRDAYTRIVAAYNER